MRYETTSADPVRAARAADAPAPRRVWIAVLFLMLVGVLNVIDRILPSVLVEPIRRDLHLSDTAIGLINGAGFLIVYAVVGIPIARLSDRGRHGAVIAACLALWSLMTLLGAATRNGWQLAATRMGVAVGEAGSSPAAQAFISRHFPPARRSAPLAVLSLSVPFATLTANIAGSVAGEVLGWRLTFAITGAVGLVMAPAALLLLRAEQPAAAPATAAATRVEPGQRFMDLFAKPSFVLLLAGSAFVGIAGYSLTTFSFSFLMRVHHMRLADVGLRYGLAVGGTGIVGLLTTALVADRLSARDPRRGLWTVAAVTAAVVPVSWAALVVTGETATLFCLACANIVALAYMAPVVAALHRLVPPTMRATASATLLLCMALFGGIGPALTGALSDALRPALGEAALGRALLVVPVAQALAALCYAATGLTFRRDMIDDDAA